jgi:hypothetical protein
MILTAEHPVTNLYRVEVSGWDDQKTFFVENSELEWSDESGKQVTLESRAYGRRGDLPAAAPAD